MPEHVLSIAKTDYTGTNFHVHSKYFSFKTTQSYADKPSFKTSQLTVLNLMFYFY